jgi:hypothetical protein
MKCIQSIRATKNTEVGVIKRINDKEAESEVKSGYWKYIPKSEWKSNKKPITTEVNPQITDAVTTPKKKKTKK